VGDTSIDVASDVVTIYKRPSVRRRARDVVAPLTREGVDEVRFEDAPGTTEDLVIAKDDVPSYEAAALEEGDVLLDEERELVVQLASVSFEGHKWRLSDGTVTFFAAIEDERFLADVRARTDVFGQGDLLRCRIRIVQTRRSGKLVTDYHVVQVLEHIHGYRQPELWAIDDTGPRELNP
jgi:hypothetical protein